MYVCIAVIHTQFSKQIKGLWRNCSKCIYSLQRSSHKAMHSCTAKHLSDYRGNDLHRQSAQIRRTLDLNITHLATLHFAIYSFLSYYSLYFVRAEEGIATCFKFPPFSETFLQVITFVSLKCILQAYSQLQSQMVYAFICSRIHKD